jgi:hypothetical protein
MKYLCPLYAKFTHFIIQLSQLAGSPGGCLMWTTGAPLLLGAILMVLVGAGLMRWWLSHLAPEQDTGGQANAPDSAELQNKRPESHSQSVLAQAWATPRRAQTEKQLLKSLAADARQPISGVNRPQPSERGAISRRTTTKG